MELESQYHTLVQSLLLLAADYETQRKVLPDFVDFEYEIVSTFEDAFMLLPQLVESEKLSLSAIAQILRTYNFVQLAARNTGVMTEMGFREAAEWTRVRNLATTSLETMGFPPQPLNLDHINWIE